MWPKAEEQRCWNHKIANVLDKLPKQAQAAARELLRQIPVAETRKEAERRRDAFVRRYQRAHPKAVETLLADWERMVTFYRFPKEHWKHLRTTNVVESPFAAASDPSATGPYVLELTCPTPPPWDGKTVCHKGKKTKRFTNAETALKHIAHGDTRGVCSVTP